MEFNDKVCAADENGGMKELMRGNFKVKINKRLKTSKKIEMFAQEPLCFFIHKRRDFLHRVQPTDRYARVDVNYEELHPDYVKTKAKQEREKDVVVNEKLEKFKAKRALRTNTATSNTFGASKVG